MNSSFSLSGILRGICVFLIATPLILSSILHLQNQFQFLLSIMRYEATNIYISAFTVLLLPIFNLLLGAWLLTAEKIRFPLFISTFLYFLFASLQLTAKLRGLEIECGCFGSMSSGIDWWSVSRDYGLSIAALFTLTCLEKVPSKIMLSGHKNVKAC